MLFILYRLILVSESTKSGNYNELCNELYFKSVYMKLRTLLILPSLLYVCTSCIRDEPLSPYADIEAFSLPAEVKVSDATINQENITVFIKKDYDGTKVAPAELKVSEGATVEPAATAPLDFSHAVTYTVTAADGVHQRTYTIQPIKSALYRFDFEHWALSTNPIKKYETPVGFDTEGNKQPLWDSGNTGVSIYISKDSMPEGYPVHKTTDAAGGSYAAEMVTNMGPNKIAFISGLNIPIVAGSLFTGKFNAIKALSDPLLATQFGQPFYSRPIRFIGKYKYKAGTGDYIALDSKGETVTIPEMKDSCSVYAIFYKSDKTLDRLDGTNVFTHPNVVALAMLPPEMRAESKGDGFVSFNLPFEYVNGTEVDFSKNEYKLGIVLSSSFYGDRYEGIIGSRLVVDDLEIIYEGEE